MIRDGGSASKLGLAVSCRRSGSFADLVGTADTVGEVGEPADSLRVQAVALIAFYGALDDPCFLEHLQMLRNGGLGKWEDADEVAGCAGVALRQLAQDPHTSRIAERPEYRRGPLILVKIRY